MNAAAAARKAMLERFHARPGPDNPAVQEQQAAREAEDQRLAAEAAAQAVALEAERKAARDARYAARKARR